jgi:hypothetical protein
MHAAHYDRIGIFRAINQHICERIAEQPPDDGMCDLICECPDVACDSSARLTLSEFEAICTSDDRLVLGTAHSAAKR